MVDEELTDGPRIADLLAAELEGFEESPFDAIELVDRERGVAPTADGTHVYGVEYDGAHCCSVFVQPDRLYLEVPTNPDAVAEAASDVGLRLRRRGSKPPSALVFVDRGADVKRVIDVLRASLPP